MRISRRLLLAATLTFAATLAAQQSEPIAQAPPQRIPPTVRISGGVMAGQLLNRVDPIYPADARANGVEGFVVLHVIVGKDGTVESATPISGPPLLRQAAVDAVTQWTYKPYLLNGEPVEVDTTVTVNFNLARNAPQQF